LTGSRWLSDRGAAGGLGELRAAVFTALLNGRPVQALLPAGMPATAGPTGPAGAPAPPVSGTIHLTMPLSAWTGQSEKAAEAAGYGPVSAATGRALAAALAASPATRWCLTLTSPAGQALAHACAPRGHSPPPDPAAAAAWASDLTRHMQYLTRTDCTHLRAEPRYRPSAKLSHLIRVRQRRCCFPGCRRPATRADLDHTIPYDQGGRTCECGLAPACVPKSSTIR
jgi:hypothetical protein